MSVSVLYIADAAANCLFRAFYASTKTTGIAAPIAQFYTIIMNCRNKNLCAMQALNSCALLHYHANSSLTDVIFLFNIVILPNLLTKVQIMT